MKSVHGTMRSRKDVTSKSTLSELTIACRDEIVCASKVRPASSDDMSFFSRSVSRFPRTEDGV